METKPSIYTWEFWLTVLAIVGTVCAAAAEAIPPAWAYKLTMVATAAFSISRGLAKLGQKPDPSVPANTKLIPKRRDTRPRA